MDLSKPDSIKAAAEQLKAQGTTFNTLVNNAGFAFKTDATEPFAMQAKVTLGINYFGTLQVCQSFWPLLVTDGTARVINVCSRMGTLDHLKDDKLRELLQREDLTVDQLNTVVNKFIETAGNQPQDRNPINTSSYSMSKVAECALTRILARENKGRVGVFASCPGWCDTAMTKDSGAPRTAEQGADVEVWLATDSKFDGAAFSGNFFAERKLCSYVDGEKTDF